MPARWCGRLAPPPLRDARSHAGVSLGNRYRRDALPPGLGRKTTPIRGVLARPSCYQRHQIRHRGWLWHRRGPSPREASSKAPHLYWRFLARYPRVHGNTGINATRQTRSTRPATEDFWPTLTSSPSCSTRPRLRPRHGGAETGSVEAQLNSTKTPNGDSRTPVPGPVVT